MPSPHVRFAQVSFSFADRALLKEVTFGCGPGWHGIVGANGDGKSTLLRLTDRSLTPSAGSVVLDHVSSLYRLEQANDVGRCGQAVLELSDANDGESRRLMGQLALDAGQLLRWPTLSAGEHMRWRVAAALYAAPTVLLLDEPTNHLDTDSTALLISVLRQFRGLGLVVSHHRQLLDGLTHSTLRVASAKVEHLHLAYSQANAVWQAAQQQRLISHRERRRSLVATRERLSGAASTLESSTRSRSAGQRMRNKYDADARSVGADFRAAQAERAHTATKRRLALKTEKLEVELQANGVEREPGAPLRIHAAPCPSPYALRLHAKVAARGGHDVLREVHFDLARAEHASIEGPNGAGKSTLLEAMRAACALGKESMFHLQQDEDKEGTDALTESLRALPRLERGRVLQWLDCLGCDPGHVLTSASLSPGEARKLRLAFGLSTPRALLLLDEPSNHLDLPSIERLQLALRQYDGALVLVTHDQALARGCCDAFWRVADGELRRAFTVRSSNGLK